MWLSVLVIGSLLTILGGTHALAQKTVDLRGQVVNGTEGSVIPDSLSVLMLITGLDGRLSGSGQAVTDAAAQGEKLGAYEPYQRYGFFGEQLTGLMGGYPGGTRMTQQPGQSPMAQALGMGIGAMGTYAGGKMAGMW